MGKRIVTRIGDIFCIEIDNDYKVYFQYIANDMTVLNSSVIRVFARRYPLGYIPVFEDIVKDDVMFYAHTILRFGIIYNAWYKVGKNADVGETKEISFRWVSEIDISKINKSHNWSVWKINQDHVFIGDMSDQYKHIDLGIVFSYRDIVNKVKNGKYLLKEID